MAADDREHRRTTAVTALAGLLAAEALGLGALPHLASRPPSGPAVAQASAPPSPASTVLRTAPRDMAEVRALVAWCREAGSRDLPRLRRLAADPDPLVAGNAIAALGRLRQLHHDPDLRARLADPRPRVRQEVVLALGRCGDLPAAGPLLRGVLHGPDRQLARLAVTALGQLGDRSTLEALAAAHADPELTALARASLRPTAHLPALATR